MQKKWTWKDYDLFGSPTIDFSDYRINAYGRTDEIAEFVEELKKYSSKSTRMLRKLVAYWGSGKSTYLYNVCYEVNRRLFFGDEVENPKEGNFTHVLAFYEKTPHKRANMLQGVYDDGLPWPWDPTTPRSVASEKGKDAWKESLRKIAYVILRRAVYEINRKNLKEAAIGGSKLRKDVFQKISSLKELKTSDFIQKIDEMSKEKDQTLEECGELMRFHIRMLLPSIEIKKGLRRIVRQDFFEQQFPQFLYPCFSSRFLEAYKELFSVPDLNLRYFPAFEKVLKSAQTYLLLIFDEVEDWRVVVGKKIDWDIHDIVVDAESPLSLVFIFRQEILRNIRSSTTLGTFMTIYDRLEDLEMKELSKEDIISLTAGILSTTREGEPKIFPLTEAFVKELSDLTRRGGSFNVRTYLRALKMILKESLEWKREKPQLTATMLKGKKVELIINQATRAEQAEASKFVMVPTRLEE